MPVRISLLFNILVLIALLARTSASFVTSTSERASHVLDTIDATPSDVLTKQNLRRLVPVEKGSLLPEELQALKEKVAAAVAPAFEAFVKIVGQGAKIITEASTYQTLLSNGVTVDSYFRDLMLEKAKNPFKKPGDFLSWAGYVTFLRGDEANKVILNQLFRYDWEKPIPVMLVDAKENEQLKTLATNLETELFRDWQKKDMTPQKWAAENNIDHIMAGKVSEAFKKFRGEEEKARRSVEDNARPLVTTKGKEKEKAD